MNVPSEDVSSLEVVEALERYSHKLQWDLDAFGLDSADVTEIYNPARFTRDAKHFGLVPGIAYDLTQVNDDGEHWDFDRQDHRRRCLVEIAREEPVLVIGSPMCSAFSTLMNWNWPRMTPEKRKECWDRACSHLRFAFAVYRLQREAGRWYLHEHPIGASSWKLEFVMEERQQDGVVLVVADQCHWGQWTWDLGAAGLAKKTTGFLTNCPEIAKALDKRCSNYHGNPYNHSHVQLVSGKAKRTEQYTPAMVATVLGALVEALTRVGRLLEDGLCMVHADEEVEWPPDFEEPKAWDDVSGAALKPPLVREARMEEVNFMKNNTIYVHRPIQECWDVTGEKPIPITWVDCNKGDDEHEDYRSRLCCRDIKKGPQDIRENSFAGMPPIEVLKMLLSITMTADPEVTTDDPLVLLLIDIKKAHAHPKAPGDIYIDLPPEDAAPGMCAKLVHMLYGHRQAGAIWEQFYADIMVQKLGFVQGKSSPCLFSRADKLVRVFVHGDDFVVCARRSATFWFKDAIGEHMLCKDRGTIGPAPEDLQEIRILNRILRYTITANGPQLEFEGDPRHVEIVLAQLGLTEGSKGKSVPGAKRSGKILDERPLTGAKLTTYRSYTMRLLYLSEDFPTLRFAVKECSRKMQSPNEDDYFKLKECCRYLISFPRLVQYYPFQSKQWELEIKVDSDHAGCLRTRRSTSGGAALHGSHCIKHYSSTQSVIAISSGESEFYAIVRGSSVGFGLISVAKDLMLDLKLVLFSDAVAGRGIAMRRGLGKVRHLDTQFLWVQDIFSRGKAGCKKIRSQDNPGDLFTKYLGAADLIKFCVALNYHFIAGTAKSALKAALT